MSTDDPAKYGLGDFYDTGSDLLLDPGREYAEWLNAAASAFDLYEPALADRPAPRTELETGPVINLASYNYLGLSNHPNVVGAAADALTRYGTGACGSPILSGMTVLHKKLEAALSEFMQRERTILFNSGNAGAIGVLSAILRRGDVAVLDEYAHICLIEGARLAGARIATFAHNDAEDLDRVLSQHEGKRRLVVVEGLYSMHGTYGALDKLVPVTKTHGVEIMVDEAHSILAVGPNGRGAAELHGVEADVDLVYGTFSKAFGNIGGFVSGSSVALNYIRYFANTYVFSAALPPAVIAGIGAALDASQSSPQRRTELFENARYFKKGLNAIGVNTGEGDTYIIPIMIGDDRHKLYCLTAALRERGVFVAPVDYPSVPENQLRMRSCVTSAHSKSDLDEALAIIEEIVVPTLR